MAGDGGSELEAAVVAPRDLHELREFFYVDYEACIAKPFAQLDDNIRSTGQHLRPVAVLGKEGYRLVDS